MTADAPNDTQAALWNERSGPQWVALQERLDAQLDHLGRAALARLPVAPGMRVLDVGCGCGGTALDIARAVAPGGSVTGVDISRVMLARARERAREAGVTNADFVEADAQTHRFDGPFDALYSRFGVMFFADPAAAFANLRRALAPGAPVAFVAWQPMERNAWMTVPLDAAMPHAANPPPLAPAGAPGPFGFADAGRTTRILADAGLVDAAAEPLDTEVTLGRDPDHALEVALRVGPCGALLRENPGALEAVREAVRAAFARAMGPSGVALPAAAWVYTARAPG